MGSWLLVALAILGTYRVGNMLTTEEGPFGLFEKFRNLFLTEGWLARGVRCFYCVSFWVALPLAILLATSLREFCVLWPGIAGGALVVEKYWKR